MRWARVRRLLGYSWHGLGEAPGDPLLPAVGNRRRLGCAASPVVCCWAVLASRWGRLGWSDQGLAVGVVVDDGRVGAVGGGNARGFLALAQAIADDEGVGAPAPDARSTACDLDEIVFDLGPGIGNPFTPDGTVVGR